MTKNQTKAPKTHRVHVVPSPKMKDDFFVDLHKRVADLIAKNGDTKRKFVSDDQRIEYVHEHE